MKLNTLAILTFLCAAALQATLALQYEGILQLAAGGVAIIMVLAAAITWWQPADHHKP